MQVVATWTGGSADALRQALRMTNESYAEHLGVSVRTVANWRKKHATKPRTEIQGILDTALDRAPDRVKAQFAALLGRADEGVPAARGEQPSGASLVPAQRTEFGDDDYLVSIRTRIKTLVEADNLFGSADVLKTSLRVFRTLHDHLGAETYDPRLERHLQSAAGELAELAGWLAYDAAEHELCRRMNQESLYFTRLAGDKTVELLTLQNSSMHAGAQGHPREALQIARSVLEGDYRLTPRLRALFLTRKARAMAQGGDGSALTLLPEIRSLFLDGVSDEDPAWAWWIDERELAWHEAMMQRDLGLSGQAIDHFERSVAATPADEIRSQYLHRAYLLQAQVDLSAWDAAEQTIRQLVPLSQEVGSVRTVVLLRDLPNQLALRAKVPPPFREMMGVFTATLDEAPV
jgi:transcriptional regulator with XRE-family HTH domain